jgi:hypothetical protein
LIWKNVHSKFVFFRNNIFMCILLIRQGYILWKSMQKDWTFDTQHAYILWIKKIGPIIKRTVSRDFGTQFFLSNNAPGSTDSWAKAVSHIDSYLRRYSTTKIDSALCYIVQSQLFFVRWSSIFNFILLPWERQYHIWSFFAILLLCYKSRNILTPRSFKQSLSATLRYATQREIQAKFFLRAMLHGVESTPRIAQSHLYLRISRRIRNHMQKWLNLLIRD